MIYFQVHYRGKIKTLKTNIQTTKTELEKARKKAKEVDRLKKQLALLQKKTNIIKRLQASRKLPARLLEEMTQVIVEKRMWFTNFKTQGRKINITGIALDNKTVADFMTRLEKANLIGAVNLRNLRHKKMRGADLKAFALQCNLAQKKKPKKKKAANKKAKI
jgi:type IV pilus assembly protein PilN